MGELCLSNSPVLGAYTQRPKCSSIGRIFSIHFNGIGKPRLGFFFPAAQNASFKTAERDNYMFINTYSVPLNVQKPSKITYIGETLLDSPHDNMVYTFIFFPHEVGLNFRGNYNF